jgi:hypothetical protein
VDGYAWTQTDWDRFPNALKITISVDGNPADVADVENGAMNIHQAIAGGYNTVYCSTSSWGVNQAAYRAAGRPQPNWWVAAYPGGGAMVPAGAIAHQYLDNGMYDVNVIADYWPGIDPNPTPEVTPVSSQFQGTTNEEQAVYIGTDGNLYHGWRNCSPDSAQTAWGWEDLGAPPTGCADSAEYLCNAEVTIQVVRVRDKNGALWCRYGTLGWAAWTELGNTPPAVGAPEGPPGPAGSLPASFGATISVNPTKDA